MKARPARTKTRPKTRPSERAFGRQRSGDGVETGVAGEAVDQRHAVEQHAGRQGAEHEIFEAGFGRAEVVAVAWRRRHRAPATAVRAPDRARSGRWPKSSAACRASPARSSTGNSKRSMPLDARLARRHDQATIEPISVSTFMNLREADRTGRRRHRPDRRRYARSARAPATTSRPTARPVTTVRTISRRQRRRSSAAPWRRPQGSAPASTDAG